MKEVGVFKWNLQVPNLQPKKVASSYPCDGVLTLPSSSNTACPFWCLLRSRKNQLSFLIYLSKPVQAHLTSLHKPGKKHGMSDHHKVLLPFCSNLNQFFLKRFWWLVWKCSLVYCSKQQGCFLPPLEAQNLMQVPVKPKEYQEKKITRLNQVIPTLKERWVQNAN